MLFSLIIIFGLNWARQPTWQYNARQTYAMIGPDYLPYLIFACGVPPFPQSTDPPSIVKFERFKIRRI